MAREPISKKQRRQLEAKTRLGHRIQPKKAGGGHRPSAGTVIDEVSTYAKDTKFVLQKVKGEGRYQGEWYRLCYWTWSAKSRKIVWGRYNPFMTRSVLRDLVRAAVAKGWEIT